MVMTFSSRVRGIAVAALMAAAALLFVLAQPANAECGDETVDDAARRTPAGDTLCGKPKPSPTPTPTQTPTENPTPQPQPSPNPGPGTPPGGFVFPPVAPGGGPPTLPPGFGQQQPPYRLPGTETPQLPEQEFNALPTGRDLAAAPGGSDGGFFARVGVLLLIATSGAAWLWRARVRRWMVGV